MVLIFLRCLGQCCFWIFFLGLLGRFVLHFCWIVLVNVGQWVQIHSSTSFLVTFGQWFQLKACHRFLSIFQNVQFLTYASTRSNPPSNGHRQFFSVSTTTCSMIRSSMSSMIQPMFIQFVLSLMLQSIHSKPAEFYTLRPINFGRNLSESFQTFRLPSSSEWAWIDHRNLVAYDHNVYDPVQPLILGTFCIESP